jgi:TetR/AcrR family transcriptional regulator, regulator of cefoperazone and chloramphenicol sensitivity
LKPRKRRSQSRSIFTRNKLLEVAIEEFANCGYEGVGTRQLAKRAGVNLSAIRYHFGDKKGLYRAVIQHVATGIRERVMSPFAAEFRSRVTKEGISRSELVNSLCQLLTRFTSNLLGPGVDSNWSRLVIHEQTNPTDCYDIIYDVQRIVIEVAALIVGKLRGQAPESKEVRIHTMSLLGEVVIFRTAPATTLRAIGWTQFGPKEISALKKVVEDHCRAVMMSRSEFYDKDDQV